MSTQKQKEYLINGDNFFPNTQAERTETLPPGAYECGVTMDGAPYLSPIQIVTDDIVQIPNSFAEDVVKEISQFWSAGVSEKFKAYGLVHKRGVLIHGRPGTGKTICLAAAAKVVINEFQGIVLFNPPVDYVVQFLRLIKDIEPTKKVLVMWEEFDSILRHDESKLLCLLDGEIQVGNVIYLATTNYISKIPSRIKNRPSRFARVIEVLDPDEATRRAFLAAKLIGEDQKHLEAMVHSTDGFVIDQLKDLIISVCCFGYPIDEAVRKIQDMNAEAVGYDDYQEQEARSVFVGLTKSSRPKPIQPLR